MGTVHVSFGTYEDVRAQVMANRGLHHFSYGNHFSYIVGQNLDAHALCSVCGKVVF